MLGDCIAQALAKAELSPGETSRRISMDMKRGAKILGEHGCFGFNTFGPFKLIGAMPKGPPTEDELAGAVRFYDALPTA